MTHDKIIYKKKYKSQAIGTFRCWKIHPSCFLKFACSAAMQLISQTDLAVAFVYY